MNDMEMSDIMEEETALPSKNWSIDRGGRTPLEVPLLAAIVRHNRIRVMKVGNHDDCNKRLVRIPATKMKGSTTDTSG